MSASRKRTYDGATATFETSLQQAQLMAQYQDFGFQLAPRLEAVAQHADEQEGNTNHATIML